MGLVMICGWGVHLLRQAYVLNPSQCSESLPIRCKGVSLLYLDVLTEVVDLSRASRVPQVVVDPAEKQCLGGQLLQVRYILTLLQQENQPGMVGQVNVRQQTNLQQN